MPVIRINDRIFSHLNSLREAWSKEDRASSNYSWNDLFYDLIREDSFRYPCNIDRSKIPGECYRDPCNTSCRCNSSSACNMSTRRNTEQPDVKKLILDACCGGRLCWFDKKHPQALYIDIVERPKGILPMRKNFSVEPDMIADFREMPFPARSFKIVLWDPPHIRDLPQEDFMRNRYGNLNGETWKYDLTKGFNECWRVLEDYGVLIFKWSENDIPLKEVLSLFPVRPLFGHTTSKHGRTKWCVFMKFPADVTPEADVTPAGEET